MIAPVPVITGCTASGKTRAALELSRSIPMEVISADSRQVHRLMDIGTAKPTREEQEVLRHHLIDVIDPDGTYSAGRFAREASELVKEIRKRGAVPVVVGGTGLYIRALTGPFDDLPRADSALRTALAACESGSGGFQRRMLERLDPVTASRIDPADAVRTLRAVEITLLSGRRASTLRTGTARPAGFDFRVVRIEVPREELRSRIASRARNMLDSGLVDEVLMLSGMGFGREHAPGRTIGYREVLDSIESGWTLEKTAAAIETGTWRFSRKQRNMLDRIPAVAATDGLDPEVLLKSFFG